MSANSTSTGDGGTLSGAVTGIVLECLAGGLLALSMTVQRHALSHVADDHLVPLLCFRVRRLVAWFFGLVVYGIASAVKVVGFNIGPFTILSSVFVGTLLVANLFFGRWLLKEPLSAFKVSGSFLVLLGACTCVVGTPTGVPTSFTSDEMVVLFGATPPQGGFFLATVLVLVCLAAIFMIVTSHVYPLKSHAIGMQGESVAPPRRSSRLVDSLMLLVYAGSLGLNESFADICVRAYSSMLLKCSVQSISCSHWTTYTLMSVGICSALSTAVYLKFVFERYETTVALPIEYGSLNLASVIGGLLFFQEERYMEPWQLQAVLAGCGTMICGQRAGTEPAPTNQHRHASLAFCSPADHFQRATCELTPHPAAMPPRRHQLGATGHVQTWTPQAGHRARRQATMHVGAVATEYCTRRQSICHGCALRRRSASAQAAQLQPVAQKVPECGL